MATLRPVGIIVGTENHTLFTFHFFTFHFYAEWRQFLRSDELIRHHVGTTDLEPVLDGIILAGNELDDELGLALCGVIASLARIQVVAHYAVLHLCHS